MLNWVEVNVIHMPLEIAPVANGVLPESTLPQRHLIVWTACDQASGLYNSVGKTAFDKGQTDGKIPISVRQRHHHVQVIGQHDNRINHVWMLTSRLHDGRPQAGNVVGQSIR